MAENFFHLLFCSISCRATVVVVVSKLLKLQSALQPSRYRIRYLISSNTGNFNVEYSSSLSYSLIPRGISVHQLPQSRWLLLFDILLALPGATVDNFTTGSCFSNAEQAVKTYISHVMLSTKRQLARNTSSCTLKCVTRCKMRKSTHDENAGRADCVLTDRKDCHELHESMKITTIAGRTRTAATTTAPALSTPTAGHWPILLDDDWSVDWSRAVWRHHTPATATASTFCGFTSEVREGDCVCDRGHACTRGREGQVQLIVMHDMHNNNNDYSVTYCWLSPLPW